MELNQITIFKNYNKENYNFNKSFTFDTRIGLQKYMNINNINNIECYSDWKLTNSVYDFCPDRNTCLCDKNVFPYTFNNTLIPIIEESIKIVGIDGLKIAYWINENLYQKCLSYLDNDRLCDFKNIRVLHRISLNKIDKLSIDKDLKLEWQNHLIELLQYRENLIKEFYINYIEKLPF